MTEFYINADPSRSKEDSALLHDLIGWYQGELDEIVREDAQTEQVRQTAALIGQDITRELEAAKSKRVGKTTVLNGLIAFLATRGSITIRPKVDNPDSQT